MDKPIKPENQQAEEAIKSLPKKKKYVSSSEEIKSLEDAWVKKELTREEKYIKDPSKCPVCGSELSIF